MRCAFESRAAAFVRKNGGSRGPYRMEGGDALIGHTGFRFCPSCGGRNIRERGGKAVDCGDCGYLYYHNTAAAAAVILETHGGILLSRRNADPGRGLLDLPGGFADYGESYESALRREIKEETGMELGTLTYFGSFPNTYEYRDVTYFTADAVFTASLPEGGPVRLSDEIREMVLVRPGSVNFDDMAFEVTKRVLKAYWKIPGG